MNYRLHPLGDSAVMIKLGDQINVETQRMVKVVTTFLDEHSWEWLIEYIPAFTTVTIFYDPVKVSEKMQNSYKLPFDYACEEIKKIMHRLEPGESHTPRVIDIPVHYGGEAGPDLNNVANHNGITAEKVINTHTRGDYLVYMIGFAPGFPYIGGMSEEIAAPRRDSPRLKIPAGTVGIAGKQTGVYPIESPGGWQLIGRTPLGLFRPDDSVPSLLKAGDKIRFYEISEEQYQEWKKGEYD